MFTSFFTMSLSVSANIRNIDSVWYEMVMDNIFQYLSGVDVRLPLQLVQIAFNKGLK